MAAPAFARPSPNEYGDRIISSPTEHAAQIHAGGRGLATIAVNYPSAGWREYTRPVERIPRLAQRYAGAQVDAYISMQEFHGRRCVANLLSLSSLYLDLDYDDIPELRQYAPHEVLDMVLSALAAQGIPPPTLAMASGNGLHLIWQHRPVRPDALPRWQAVERHLVEALSAYGADPAVTDPARVLRLVGTRNGQREVTSLLPVGEVYDFNHLADRVLPRTRAELRDIRLERARSAARKPRESRPAPPKGEGYPAAVITDLHALRGVRGDAKLHRRRWMHIYSVMAAKIVSDPEALRRDCHRMAAAVGGWSPRQTDTALGTTLRRAEAAHRGETIEYRGQQVDPRYNYSARALVELLEITPAEQQHMRVLISPEERRRRRAGKQRQRREESGAMTREEYEGRAAQRRSEARRMAAEGKSRREIAEALAVSKASVTGYLREPVEARPEAGGDAEGEGVKVRGGVCLPPSGAVRLQEDRANSSAADVLCETGLSASSAADFVDPSELRYQRLRALLGYKVRTRHGDGRVWQTFRDQIGVVLDCDELRVEFMSPEEIDLEESVA